MPDALHLQEPPRHGREREMAGTVPARWNYRKYEMDREKGLL